MGRGHSPDESGRRRPGRDQHLRVVTPRAARGRIRLPDARRRRRASVRRRNPDQPRHRHRLTAGLAGARPPSDPSHRRRWDAALPRGSSGVVRELPRIPGCRAAPCAGRGRALRGPPRARAVARLERAGMPQRALLLRRQRRRVPCVAASAVWQYRCAQRCVGHGVLESDVSRMGGDRASARRSLGPQSRPDPRFPPVQLRRAARLLSQRGGGHPRRQRRAGHDELHADRPHRRPRLLVVGERDGRDRQRSLPRPPSCSPYDRARVRRRPHPRGERG